MTRSIVGGVSNLFSGEVLFNVGANLIGNLIGQTTNPCFKDIDWSQAATAAFLGKYNLGGSAANKIIPNSLNNVLNMPNITTGQLINTGIVSSL